MWMCDLFWDDPVWLMGHIVKNPKTNFVHPCFSHYDHFDGDRRSQKTKVKLFSSSSPQCFEWKLTEHLHQCEPALMCAAWIMNAINVKATDLWGCAFSGLYQCMLWLCFRQCPGRGCILLWCWRCQAGCTWVSGQSEVRALCAGYVCQRDGTRLYPCGWDCCRRG